MAAFVIVDITVANAVQYEEYRKLAATTVLAHGGKYLVRGGKVEVLEGDWCPSRFVILEFPNAEKARTWLNSDEYRAPRAIRHASSRTNMILVEGVPGT